jgi:predicted AlkP superfamily pyrophosphatase or phosphodiesterase
MGTLQLLRPAASAEPERARKVLFIGIDGCRFDALRQANTPHLDRLMQEGAWADNTLILGPRYRANDTVSGPGWSSLLTGVWADKHGVHDNKFRKPNYREYPHFFARLKQAQPRAFTASLVNWEPIHQHIVSSADVVKTFGNGNIYIDGDIQSTQTACELLRERNPTALFVYLGQVDEHGHKYGFHPTVPKYIEAIERVDRHVGELLAAMNGRKTLDQEDWLVLVTSDHGGRGKDHADGHNVPEILNSFMIVSGRAGRRGKIEEQTYLVDVPVTALVHLGVKIDAAWKLDGVPRGLRND